jgi:transcriptional regulator with XRE-family HTH domain
MSLVARSLRFRIAEVVRETRLALGWSQAELGRRAGVSQSTICRIERGGVERLTFETAARVLDTLGVRVSLDLRAPLIDDRRLQRDAGHARCVAYVARRLERQGWLVSTEVEVFRGRARGWIDLLAYRESDSTMLLVEVKTEVNDMGATLRQFSWYERDAWPTARRIGWHPRRLVGLLLILSSSRNIMRLHDNRDLLHQSFPVPIAQANRLLAGYPGAPVAGRALALIDPYERSSRWLLRSPLHGRANGARYRDYAELVARIRGGRAA